MKKLKTVRLEKLGETCKKVKIYLKEIVVFSA